jgi:hypothetical protein
MTEAQPRLVDTGRGYTVAYKGKTLYSPMDPEGGALRRVAQLTLQPNTLVFVPSLGLGYGLRELLGKLPESCHIICIEVDEHLFKLGVTHHPLLPRDPRLTILRSDKAKQVAAVVHRLGCWHFRRVVTLHLCAGYQLHRSTYRKLRETVEEEIRLFWQNKITLVAMTRLWLKNLFTNLRHLPFSGDITDLTTPRPVLVCGAGPSLESSLEWIDKIRKKVILIAVDTALPVLAAAKLPPDWVFTLDAQIHTLRDFLPFRDARIRLLCDLTSNPQSLRLFPDLFFFSSRFHPLSLFDRLEAARLLPSHRAPRGSVGVAAVEAALTITAGPVLFTGLDFSYPGGKTHVRGAPLHLALLEHCGRLRSCSQAVFEILAARPRLRVKDKNGNPALSDLVLQSYAHQLQAISRESGSGRCFDMGVQGLSLGARRIESLPQLLDLCDSWDDRRGGRDLQQRTAAGAEPTAMAEATVKADTAVEAVISFCEQEQQLLAAVAQSKTAAVLKRAVSPVEYLLLSLPVADPDRQFSALEIGQIQAEARLLSVCLQRTRDVLAAVKFGQVR